MAGRVNTTMDDDTWRGVLNAAIRAWFFRALTRGTRTRRCVTKAVARAIDRRWGGDFLMTPTSYSRRWPVSVWRRH